MKRTVALAILGVAAATTAYGQGGIQFGNYFSPYTPTSYDASVPNVGGNAVAAGDGVAVSVWWGEGAGLPAGSLTPGGDFVLNAAFDGYYGPQLFEIPNGDGAGLWAPGETWTFQFRASGNVLAAGQPVDEGLSVSPTFSLNTMADLGASPPGVPPFFKGPESSFTVYTIIPEPTTFALAGLGAAALLIFRRRD